MSLDNAKWMPSDSVWMLDFVIGGHDFEASITGFNLLCDIG